MRLNPCDAKKVRKIVISSGGTEDLAEKILSKFSNITIIPYQEDLEKEKIEVRKALLRAMDDSWSQSSIAEAVGAGLIQRQISHFYQKGLLGMESIRKIRNWLYSNKYYKV